MPVDPLDALQPGEIPVEPRSEFRADLHRRLVAAVRGTDAPVPASVTAGRPSWLYYFTLPTHDVARAQRFYTELFGWAMTANADDSGLHVEGVQPPMGVSTNSGADARLWFVVDDVHAAVATVRRHGGAAGEPVHYESGSAADCRDDQGTEFSLSEPSYPTEPVPSTRAGELFYFSMPVADGARARAFFGAVFGWTFDPPGPGGGQRVANSQPDGGIDTGFPGHAPTLFFRVDDLEAAMATVRSLGGTAEAVGGGAEGVHAICTDDQGVTFGLSQPNPGY